MNMKEVEKTLGELEKKELLKDLNKLLKALRSYKNLQEKRLKVPFNENQKRRLNFLRQNIKQQYVLHKKLIAEYGTNTQVIVLGQPWDIFNYVLRTLNMNPDQFNKLEKSMNIIETTIKNIKATPVAKFEISLSRKIAKPVKELVIEKETLINHMSIMEFHPKIIEVSKSLYETGHFSQAIFEAFKAVNNAVKEKTGLSPSEIRGMKDRQLMAKVFDEKAPLIKLNELLTDTDINEQEGFKFLFMGATVGIRNPKAHESIVQKDPYKTLEYLAFASLLMRRIKEGKVVKLKKYVQTI